MAHWTVGELSQRSGAAVSAIHFYERRGLIHGTRTAGNQRRFERDTLRRIAIIRVAQDLGIPLARIKEAFDVLPHARATSKRDWQRLSRRWADELDQRIAALRKLRTNLDTCIGCGCLSLERCAILNRDDKLAAAGPGPARLLPK